jgi:hypothetical protein
MWILIDKVFSLSGTTKDADIIPLLKVATRRTMLGTQYTVTDADISAGETVKGLVQQLYCTVDRKVIFDIQTDELDFAAALCDAVESAKNGETNARTPVTALYSDATPTTEELQRAWYILDLPHDYRIYQNAPKLSIKTRAVTDEWGGATAFTGYFFVAIETGNVEESAALVRSARGTSTKHDLETGDYTITGVLLTGPAANTYSRVQLPGKDGRFEIDTDEPIIGQAVYNMMTGQAPGDDDVDYQMFVGIASAPFEDRFLHVELTTTSAIVAFLYVIMATHSVAADAPIAVISRGEAVAPTALANSDAPVRSLPMVPRGPVGLAVR